MFKGMRRRLEGAVDATLVLAAAELGATLLPLEHGPIAALVKRQIDTTPGPVIDFGIATLETKDKLALRATVIGGWAAAGAALPARAPRRRIGWRRPAAIAAAAAAAIAIDRAKLRRLEAKRQALPAGAPPPGDGDLRVDGISPLFTPTSTFYTTDTAARPPRVDPDAWRLRVHGMVERPLELSLSDLEALGLEELDATLVCVHNPVGGDRIGTARWRGVPLARVLEAAGAASDAEQLVAHSVDGFTA